MPKKKAKASKKKDADATKPEVVSKAAGKKESPGDKPAENKEDKKEAPAEKKDDDKKEEEIEWCDKNQRYHK